jgi:tetratricopeptide (TPR) repeat protein
VGDERVRAEEVSAGEICRLLGNLPLAVKIAARRLASRPRWRLADLAARLRDETKRLEELKLRDREVRASFAVSWNVLDDDLRRIFALLAVFEGRPFRAAALAAVAEIDRRVAEDKLYALVSLSLVSEEGEMHYRQHPLLADFAREQLGQDEAAYTRMIQYYLAYATEHRHNYFELEQEGDNFLASMRLAYQQKMWPLIIDYAELLVKAGFARARFSDIRQACQLACEAARILGNRPSLAAGLRQWGRACIEQGDYAEAEEHLSDSLQICLELDDQPGVANAQYYLGRIAKEQVNFEKAQQLLTESRRIREHLGNMSGVAETLYLEADIPYFNGNYEEAKQLGRQALDLQQAAGDKLGSIRSLGLLADIALKQDDHALGERYCQQALALCEEIQEKGELAVILYILSEVCRQQGRLKSARDYAEKSLTLLTHMGDRKTQANALWRLSIIDADLQDYALALEEGLQSLNLHQELKDKWGMIYVLLHLGDIHRFLDQIDRGREIWSEALSFAEELQHPLTGQLRERLDSTA